METKKTTKKKATTRTKKIVEKAEKPVAELVKEDEKKTVNMQFSIDPAYPPEYQFFEIMIDGVSYTYPRGEMVEVPVEIYNIVKEREDYRKKSQMSYAGYTRPEGMNIT